MRVTGWGLTLPATELLGQQQSSLVKNVLKACNVNKDQKIGQKSCMHGSIIDMIFSSIKIIPSTESPNWGKTYFSLLSLGKTTRVEQIYL